MNSGQKFKKALNEEKPLQIVGAINAYTAIMAKEVGFHALYLSGAAVSNFSFGIPDIGIISFGDVLEEACRILKAVDLPLIVDIDTGFGSFDNLKRAIRSLNQAGSAGVHLEDQTDNKKCGHLEGKKLISKDEMCKKIEIAITAKQDADFVIIARTDAYLVEGLEKTIDRLIAYQNAGADLLFLEAFSNLNEYKKVKEVISIPIIANITEFGKTSLFTKEELLNAGVDAILYPLSAARAMNLAALKVYEDIKLHGTQKQSIPNMQTRDELYHFLNYDQN